MKKTAALILAGGSGCRFGAEIPKQFIPINGKPMLSYSIEVFQKHPDISDIVISVHPDYMTKVTKDYPSAIVVEGGKSRPESSFNALRACPSNTDYVFIHDAARPFVDNAIINRCLHALYRGHIAVNTAIAVNDTVVYVDDDGVIQEMPDRRYLKCSQTPQAFVFKKIMAAFETPVAQDIPPTDDIRYMFNCDVPCICVDGSEFNIKITRKVDLILAERIALMRQDLVSSTNP